MSGLDIHCIAEETPLGRGGAFRNAYREAALADPLVIATNGDVLTSQALAALTETHLATDALATLMLTPMISPFGIVETSGRLVTGFAEKPPLPTGSTQASTSSPVKPSPASLTWATTRRKRSPRSRQRAGSPHSRAMPTGNRSNRRKTSAKPRRVWHPTPFRTRSARSESHGREPHGRLSRSEPILC